MTASIRPFAFDVAAAAVTDLHERIDRTRWPREINDPQWSYGVSADYVRELTSYWRNKFDWPAAQARINSLPQFLTCLDGLDIHFVHARSKHPEATALLITHGWPGSIVEFLAVIPRLTDPERFGGKAEDAFHVVAPSLQGYGGSPPATTPHMSPKAIARRHVLLMERLGYSSYLAQGGDWGSLVAHYTAELDPQHCKGLHLNLLLPIPPKDVASPLELVEEREKSWLGAVDQHVTGGTGYFQIQRTKPQTLSYALSDSPVGWCAWVTEKFHGWTDCERDGIRDPRNAVSWDAMLTNISLYWFTETIASSMRLYKEQALAEVQRCERPGPVQVRTGVAVYPGEIFRSPRAWAERRFPLVHWYEAPKGGHFAAMEQPELFAADLRQFRRALPAGGR